MLQMARTSKAQKRLGVQLDAPGMGDVRQAIVRLARESGVVLEEGAETWPGKKLLRRAQGREEQSRVRTNPIARDEAFVCAKCGARVRAHGRTARDHCPKCLYSVHVDVVPGDRAAGCGGLLGPVAVELRAGHPYLVFRCERCGERRINQAILDGDDPDNYERILALTASVDNG